MSKASRQGYYKIEYHDKKGNKVEAKLEIRFKKSHFNRPLGRNKNVILIFQFMSFSQKRLGISAGIGQELTGNSLPI